MGFPARVRYVLKDTVYVRSQCTVPSPQEEGHAGAGTEGREQDGRLPTVWAGFVPHPCASELCCLTGSGSERVTRPLVGTERVSQLHLPQGTWAASPKGPRGKERIAVTSSAWWGLRIPIWRTSGCSACLKQ